MKTLKKVWIFLLLVCLAALFSTVVLADDATSGTCGENATWTLEDGILTISGTGDMEDYGWINAAPWYSKGASIISIVIEDGITSVGDLAFYWCESMTNITIPDSVTSIGSYAFGGCSELKSISIPNNVTSLGNYVFSNCSSLESIAISDSVTSIGYYSFVGCSSLAMILVSEGNTTYRSEDGVLFNTDKMELVCYPAGKTDTFYEIQDFITSIGGAAFYGCSNLTSYC